MNTVWTAARIAVLGPFPPRPGGVSVQCEILANKLEEAGARVTRINTDVPGLRQRGGWRKGLLPPAQLAGVTRELRRTRDAWDVLHVHAASWWGFMPAVLGLQARRWGKRLALSYHGGEAARFMARYGRFATAVLRRYHTLLTLTPTQRDIFQRYGLTVTLLPNIVPISHFHFRLRGPLHPRLLWLRHLEPRYRPTDALDVFRRIRQDYPQATLVVAGGGSLLAPMQQEVSARGLAGVTFTGPLSSAAIPAAYDAADIFLNTSAVDNQPLTLIEASASGLPIVSTNAGAIPDLISDGENGLLSAVGDADALATAIRHLLADADLARRLSLAARDNARQYDWPQIAPRLARAYGLL